MFSCGIDSTYLAWSMRRDPNVHLHHISIKTMTPLWKEQDARVYHILSYFKKQGCTFEYSESTFEFMLPQMGYDSDLLLLVASKVVQNFKDDWIEVYMGWNPTDMKRTAIAERAERNVTPNIWKALVQSTRNRQCIDEKLHFPLIEQNIVKADMIREMPTELLDLTYSCRYGNLCGKCHACRDIEEAKLAIG